MLQTVFVIIFVQQLYHQVAICWIVSPHTLQTGTNFKICTIILVTQIVILDTVYLQI